MSPLRSGFGEQIQFGSLGSGQGAVPSSAIGGLSSRQVVFGSPSGGVAQSAALQFDSTLLNLGVGTSAPAVPLHVARTTDEVLRIDSSAANGAFIRFMDGTTAKFFFGWGPNTIVGVSTASAAIAAAGDGLAISGNGGGAEHVRVSSTGRVGIGTTNPLAPLHVERTTDELGHFRSTLAGGAYLRFYDGTSGRGYLGWGSNIFVGGANSDFGLMSQARLLLGHSNGSIGVTLNTSGHVGIGTTAPVAALTVADSTGGNITLTGGANAQIVAHGNLFLRTTGANAINFQPQSDVLGPAGSFSSQGHFSAVNNVRLSSGTNVTFSAFGVAGTTQASSYTTGSASTGRTLPSTITTVAGLMSAAERENFNRMAQTLETLVKKDLLGYGWTR